MNKDSVHIDESIVLILEKLNQIQRSLMWEIAIKEKVSPVQMQFLVYIEKNPDSLCKVSVLSREFELTKATVSDAITTLVSKKLVVRVKEKEDKRSFHIVLTGMGKKVVKKVSRWSDVLKSQIENFPAHQKETVFLFLMELVKSLFDEGAINTPRICLTCGNFQKNADTDISTPYRCNLTGKNISINDLNVGCSNFVK